jgi:hypothetical protein
MTVLRGEDVRAFHPEPSGRKRLKAPEWRRYYSRGTLLISQIHVQIRPDSLEELRKKLQNISQDRYNFTSNVARYIIGDSKTVQIIIIWKSTEIPNEATREQDLQRFRSEFADVLDWSTAQYDDKDIWLYT